MNNYNIAFEFKETLQDALVDSSEFIMSNYFLLNLDCYSQISSGYFSEKLKKFLNDILIKDEYFEKCRNLSMIDFVVPVYDEDDQFLFYLSYDEAILLRG